MSEETVEVQTAESTGEQAATEAASIAAVGAVVASETAAEAREIALAADEHAGDAWERTEQVTGALASELGATNETVAAVAERSVSRQDFEAFRNEMAPVLKRFADMEAERIANEQKDEGVEEIDVTNGGTAAGSAGNSGTDDGNPGHDSGSTTVSSERVAARRGLRHRHSR